MIIDVFIDGLPRPQGSKTGMVGKDGRVRLWEASKGLEGWRSHCYNVLTAWRLSQKDFKVIEHPVEVMFDFYFCIPKSKVGKVQLNSPFAQCPDLSKLIRAVEDSMVDAKILLDDKLICSLRAKKVYGYESGVSLVLNAYESE